MSSHFLAAFSTVTCPSGLATYTFPSAPTGDDQYCPSAPVSRPCLSTSPVFGSSVVRMPPSFIRKITPLYSSGDGTLGTGLRKRHSTCVSVTSPLPPARIATVLFWEVLRAR